MFGTYRTLLALMVVALHLGGAAKLGAYAVFGFYSLSGYLMTFIIHKNYGYSPEGYIRYILNRILRVYPLYWVSIFSTILIISYFGSYDIQQYHASMFLPRSTEEILRNIFIIFPDRNDPRLTPPSWALTVELFFYIAIGFGISKTKYFTLAWFIISIMYHALAVFQDWGWEERYYTIQAASLPFSTGALLFHYSESIKKKLSYIKISDNYKMLATLMILMVLNWATAIAARKVFDINLAGTLFFYTNYFITSLILLFSINASSLGWIGKESDKWIGDLSYPIYLFHYQVGMLTIAIARQADIHLVRPSPGLFFLSLPAILAVAIFLAKIIERPIDRLRSKVKGE